VSRSTGTGFSAPAQWMQHGGSFTRGEAQYADVNGDGKIDLLLQANDNNEYLSLRLELPQDNGLSRILPPTDRSTREPRTPSCD
jgi:hypothetical protein